MIVNVFTTHLLISSTPDSKYFSKCTEYEYICIHIYIYIYLFIDLCTCMSMYDSRTIKKSNAAQDASIPNPAM